MTGGYFVVGWGPEAGTGPVLLPRIGNIVIADAACPTLSTAAVALELHSNAACVNQMPLANTLGGGLGTHRRVLRPLGLQPSSSLASMARRLRADWTPGACGLVTSS